MSSCEDFDALAKSFGITNKEVINFAKNTEPAEINLSNFNAKMQESVKSSSKFSSVISSVGKTVLSTFGNIAIMYAASLAINLAVTAIDNYIHRTEKLIEAGEKAQNTIKEIYDTYDSKVSTVNTNKNVF